MEKHQDYVLYDGQSYAVFTHRTEHTVLGTAWRFIMDHRKTLVIVPFQTSKNIPANPGFVPRDVHSVLTDLALLAYAVLDAYMPQEGAKAFDDVLPYQWAEYASGKLKSQDKVAEKAALDLIRTRNERWHGTKQSIARLRELRDVLFNMAHRNTLRGNCTHGELTCALIAWKEVTGHDPTENIIHDYADGMPGVIEEAARQMAAAEATTVQKARRLVIERINYVAEVWANSNCELHENKVLVLLQDARFTVHNKEDEEEFRRVAPTEAEREQVEIETKKIQVRGISERIMLSDYAQTKGGAMTHKLAKCPRLYTHLSKCWKAHERGSNRTSKRLFAEFVLGRIRGVPARSTKEAEVLQAVTARDVADWARRGWPTLKASRYGKRANA